VPEKSILAFIEALVKEKDAAGDSVAKWIGLGARDTLRLEAGLCLYGHELNETISPIEAVLGWTISKRRKEHGGFLGFETVKKHIKEGVTRKRVGFIVDGPPARETVEI
jgi:aminomethyltransferase